MHTKYTIRFPNYFLDVEIFMTFISTERLNDSVFPNFERDAQTLLYNRFAHQENT